MGQKIHFESISICYKHLRWKGRHFIVLFKNVHTYGEDNSFMSYSRGTVRHKKCCSSEKMHWQKYASNWCVIRLVFTHHQRICLKNCRKYPSNPGMEQLDVTGITVLLWFKSFSSQREKDIQSNQSPCSTETHPKNPSILIYISHCTASSFTDHSSVNPSITLRAGLTELIHD